MIADAITAETLLPLLRERLDPAATCNAPWRSAAGNGQETWFITVHTSAGERPLVLRRSAADGTLNWTDREAEFAVLAAVRDAGLPVPEVLWLDADGGVLDRPYFVMERLPGQPPRPLHGPERTALSHELGELLARLHGIDAHRLNLALHRPRDAAAGARAELERWARRYAADRLGAMPLLGGLLAWLQANVPDTSSSSSVTLLWGDAGPHNLLVHEGHISALLDWELAHIGDPLDDLAVAQWSCLDVLDPDELLVAYEARAPIPVDRDALRWFRCLACVSRTVMLLGGNRAYVEQHTNRPSLAGLGLDLVSRNLAQGASEAGWGELGSIEPPAGAPVDTVLPVPRPDMCDTAHGLARFLTAEVLPATNDRALRRELKAAVGLLQTLAVRAQHEASVQAARHEQAQATLATLELGNDVEAAARRCELEPNLIHEREKMRALLLADHARGDALLAPLRRLFTGG